MIPTVDYKIKRNNIWITIQCGWLNIYETTVLLGTDIFLNMVKPSHGEFVFYLGWQESTCAFL